MTTEATPTGEQSQPDDGGTAAPESTTETTTETTGASETTGEATAEGGEQAGGETPVEYTAFTMPEGVEVNQELMDAFTPLAQEAGLSQEAAQKIVDLQTGAIVAEAQAREDAFQTQVKDWQEVCRKDPEFGGEKLAENSEAAAKFVARVGTPELRKLLQDTGLEHHPELQRIFHRCAKAISEDTHVAPTEGGGKPTTMAERMYPDMAKT